MAIIKCVLAKYLEPRGFPEKHEFGLSSDFSLTRLAARAIIWPPWRIPPERFSTVK